MVLSSIGLRLVDFEDLWRAGLGAGTDGGGSLGWSRGSSSIATRGLATLGTARRLEDFDGTAAKGKTTAETAAETAAKTATHAAESTSTTTKSTATILGTSDDGLDLFLDWLNLLGDLSEWRDDFSDLLDDWLGDGVLEEMWLVLKW